MEAGNLSDVVKKNKKKRKKKQEKDHLGSKPIDGSVVENQHGATKTKKRKKKKKKHSAERIDGPASSDNKTVEDIEEWPTIKEWELNEEDSMDQSDCNASMSLLSSDLGRASVGVTKKKQKKSKKHKKASSEVVCALGERSVTSEASREVAASRNTHKSDSETDRYRMDNEVIKNMEIEEDKDKKEDQTTPKSDGSVNEESERQEFEYISPSLNFSKKRHKKRTKRKLLIPGSVDLLGTKKLKSGVKIQRIVKGNGSEEYVNNNGLGDATTVLDNSVDIDTQKFFQDNLIILSEKESNWKVKKGIDTKKGEVRDDTVEGSSDESVVFNNSMDIDTQKFFQDDDDDVPCEKGQGNQKKEDAPRTETIDLVVANTKKLKSVHKVRSEIKEDISGNNQHDESSEKTGHRKQRKGKEPKSSFANLVGAANALNEQEGHGEKKKVHEPKPGTSKRISAKNLKSGGKVNSKRTDNAADGSNHIHNESMVLDTSMEINTQTFFQDDTNTDDVPVEKGGPGKQKKGKKPRSGSAILVGEQEGQGKERKKKRHKSGSVGAGDAPKEQGQRKQTKGKRPSKSIGAKKSKSGKEVEGDVGRDEGEDGNHPNDGDTEEETEGTKVESRRWTKAEDQRLRQNMENFCKEHNIKKSRQLLFTNECDDKDIMCKVKQLIRDSDFYDELGEGIGRSFQSIYARAKKIFDDQHYKGKWTKEEIEELLRLYRIHGPKWKIIGQILERSARSVGDKYRLVKQERAKGEWSKEEKEQLKAAMLEVCGDTPKESVNIPWSKIAAKVPTRNLVQCRAQWLLRKKNANWTCHDSVKLIKKLYDSTFQVQADVNWLELLTHFPRLSTPQLLKRKWNRMKENHVANHEQKSFRAILSELHHDVAPIIVKETPRSPNGQWIPKRSDMKRKQKTT